VTRIVFDQSGKPQWYHIKTAELRIKLAPFDKSDLDWFKKPISK
jgi:hypothetical protein